MQSVLTRVSTVSPRAAASRAATPAATSTRPPSGRRRPGPGRPARGTPSPGGGAGRWSRRRRRRCASASSSRKSPAPPHTATRRTTRSGSPATRTPRAVCGSALATSPAKSRSVVALDRRRPGRRRSLAVPGSASSTTSYAAPRRGARRARRDDLGRGDARRARTSIRTSSTTSSSPTVPTVGLAPVERPEPALARRRERRGVVVADPPGAGLGQSAPRTPLGVATGTNTVSLSSGVPLGAQRPDVGEPERRGQRVRDARARPGRRWCGRSAARTRRRTSVASVRPFGVVSATPCTPRRNSGWCTTSRSAPHAAASRATCERRVDGEQHLARPPASGSPCTSPTASHSSAVSGGYQPCSRSTTSLRGAWREASRRSSGWPRAPPTTQRTTRRGQLTCRSRPSQYGARSLNFCSLPVAVRASSSRNSTDVGAL